jgi:SAM-dependent methyltransferase
MNPEDHMEGFDPRTSFGYDVSKRYVAADTRGDEEQTVAFLAQLAGQRDALEFAVGTGRIALPLMRAGVCVDGIEMSRHMVDRMREKPDGNKVEVTIGDMARVSTGRTYGLVYLVYNTIGNLLTQDDQVRCFENAARHLTDDGAFVLECRVPTASSRSGHQFVDAEHVGVDHVVLDVCRYDPVTQILDKTTCASASTASSSARSVCAWPTRPSSTSWLASPAFDCAPDGAGGTVSRTPPPAGATSASTSERLP